MAINSGEYPYGLVAGGMVDGNIHVWDPARLAAGDPESLIASVGEFSYFYFKKVLPEYLM